ncbi:phage baseplate assembly protein V [Endozoicomonas acroporae]|uniref:phage baseplate assembly protein V n=1 Tax=Endozoicomonas acroporae TaxID=1701104 RepID=UPI0013D49065|nr:phage baseplate assembly protein V [Endozoicomonas acroporae]
MSFRLSDLERRVAGLINVGRVADLDEQAARVRVEFGEILTDWLPWLTTRAGFDRSWWAPEVGEQVLILAPSGELAQAVVLPAIYRDSHPAPVHSADLALLVFSDGTTIQYDRGKHALTAHLPAGGTTTLTSPGKVTINAAGGVVINGNVTVNGNISASGDVADGTRSMRGDRGIYNGHNHTGNLGNPTSGPNSKQ